MQKKGRNAKKKQKCEKKTENARSISKLMQKKGRNAKKGRKYIFNFEIHTKKKSKMEKRKQIYLDFLAFISPVHFVAF